MTTTATCVNGKLIDFTNTKLKAKATKKLHIKTTIMFRNKKIN